MRGHFAELFEGIDYHSYYEGIQQISVIHLTDCRSLYDLLHRRGTVPSERRLLIDIEALRNDIETNGVVSRWINTKQMLADCLTKDDARAADYLRYVLRYGTYQIVEDLMADQIIYNQRMKLKEKKSKYFCEKYPKRRRPAEQHYIDAGITYFNDALAETSYRAKRFRAPTKNGLHWRWTLGQVGDEGFYQELEDMVDWSALGETMRRRLIPSRVRKLLTVWAPTRKSLEQWSDVFKQGHTVTRVNLENDDAFSFFVEPSFSGNDVFLDKVRHTDEDDDHDFLDILRTSLMTFLRLLVESQQYLCRAVIPSEEVRTILLE